MGTLFRNKIAFCGLATALLIVSLNQASQAAFAAIGKATSATRFEVSQHHEQDDEGRAPRDMKRLVASADARAGKDLSDTCRKCHHLEPDAGSLQGPNLFAVVGRDIASVPRFRYSIGSDSLSALEGVWTYDMLDRFLEAPKSFVPATKMNFVGMPSQHDRADLIAYLEQLASGDGDTFP